MNNLETLTANVKAVATYIKANKDSFGISGNITQSAVKNWMNSASEEELSALVENCGIDVTITTPASNAGSTVSGLNVEHIEIETTAGLQSVAVVMIAVKKWDVSKAKSKETGRTTYTPVLKLDLNGVTLSCNHELFKNKEVRDSIIAGDLVPVREESIDVINGVGRNGVAYTAYRGAILEAAIPALQQARMELADREIALAGMSKEAQVIVNGTSANKEAEAFFAKFTK